MHRVLDIILEVNEICRLDRSISSWPGGGPPEDETDREYRLTIDGKEHILFDVTSPHDVLQRELNIRLQGYTTLPSLSLRKGDWRVQWGSTVPQGTHGLDTRLVPLLIDAVASGDLKRLWRCEYGGCRRWILRRRLRDPKSFQRFCPGPRPCRQKAFEGTAEFRKNRAEYMKQYRKDEAARKRKAKTQARKVWEDGRRKKR
jgi:hypothetical protein